jgi:deoxyribonuclease-4
MTAPKKPDAPRPAATSALERQAGLVGAHMSIAGGLHTAVERAVRAGCTALQMFVKNNNQWQGKPLTDADVATYQSALSNANLGPVVVHDTYLINLCAVDPVTLERSRAALQDELERCERLGIPYLNLHPGSHMGAGEEAGIERIAESLDIVHAATSGFRVKSVLETTAGQGSAIGYRFEHLRAIIDRVKDPDRMAVCVDTCHIFAAGYDIVTKKGYERTFQEFDDVVGIDRLVAFHVNDSKKGPGSRVDRHEHIGKGAIGLEGFRHLMNDPRFTKVPKLLETPKSEDLHEDIENLAILRGLIHRTKSAKAKKK